jgi:hypothetical protein
LRFSIVWIGRKSKGGSQNGKYQKFREAVEGEFLSEGPFVEERVRLILHAGKVHIDQIVQDFLGRKHPEPAVIQTVNINGREVCK